MGGRPQASSGFLVRRVAEPRTRVPAMTMSIDLFAMCLGWAGVPGPKVPKRDAILIEYFSDAVFRRVRKMGYKAVRTERWKYIRYKDTRPVQEELFDLKADPLEEQHLAANPAQAETLAKLRARCDKLRRALM